MNWDFLSGAGIGGLIFISAFWIACQWLKGKYPTNSAQVNAKALPFIVKSDAQERAIELEQYNKAGVGSYDFRDDPDGIGR